jgi:PIN like domain
MKICADENISHRLVEIVNDLSGQSLPRLLHVSEIGAQGVKDVIWVRTFADQNGEAILTADANMSKRQSERIAIGEAGLRLLILPTQYQQGGTRFQAAYMLLWWSRIVELVRQGERGCVLNLPTLTLPKAMPVWERIDVQAARKRLEKSKRPNRRKQV